MEAKLGDKIRQRRKQMGMTLKDLAAGRVTAAQISAVEKGKCRPSPSLLSYIAERLGVDVDYFTLTEEERYRKKFDEIKEKSEELFNKNQFITAKEYIGRAVDMLSYLSEAQKGFFYYFQGNCLYKTEQYAEAFDFFIRSLTYYLKTKEKNITADIYIKAGNCLYNTSKYDMALGYYLSAHKYIDDELDLDITARILHNIVLCYTSLKRYSMSREFLDRFIAFVNEREWPEKKRFLPGIDMMNGVLEKLANQNKQSYKKFDEAFLKYKKEGDIVGMGKAKNNAALCLWDIGQREKAIEYYKEAIDYKIISADETLSETFIDLANLYKEIGELDKSMEVIEKAEEKMIAMDNTSGLIDVFMTKFDYFVDMGAYDRAEVFAFLALDYIQKSGNIKMESKLYIKLSEMYRKMGDDKNSIEYVLKAKTLTL